VFCQSAAFFCLKASRSVYKKEHNELELQFNIKDMQQSARKNTLQYLIDMQLETGAWRMVQNGTHQVVYSPHQKILSQHGYA